MRKALITIISILCTFPVFSQFIDAELFYSETNISVDNGKVVKTIINEIKINNRAGEKYTLVQIPFSNSNKISKIEAYIKDRSGSIIKKLKKNDIVIKSAIADYSLYEDDYVMEFTLKHNNYPYFVHYEYQERFNNFLYIEYWRPVLDINIPTVEAKLNLEIPKNYKIAYKCKKIDALSADSSGSTIIYNWITSFKNEINNEIFSPSVYNYMPSVIIVPEDFIYEKEGSFKNWNTYGNWQYELNLGLEDLPESEKNIIFSLVSNINEEKEKIKTLYHYLQDHTRYINISIGTGGMKPYPASYVAENKYGDCKALTNYFKSLLNYAGISSYYAKVNAGENIDAIDLSFPSQQFNHVILFIPLKNDTIWLDCTSKMAFNYLGTFTQNRQAFVVDKDISSFKKTPALKYKDVLERRVIKIRDNQLSESSVNFYNTYMGTGYESLFHITNNYNQTDKSRIIRNYYIENGFEALDYKIIKEHRDSTKIHLTYSAKTNKIYKKYGNEVLIKLIPFSLPKFENPLKRKLSVKIDFPIFKIDSIEYSAPNGYSLSSSMENKSITTEFGEYKIEFSIKDDIISVVKSFYLKSGEYSLSNYGKIYDFVNDIAELENETYLITTLTY